MANIPNDLIKGSTVLYGTKTEPARLITFYPWVFPPQNFIPFDVVDVRTVGPGSTVDIPIIQTATNNGVIRWFGNECSSSSGYADIRWSILLNQRIVDPYNSMRESRGAISDPDPIIIPILLNTIVSVRVQNLSSANSWEVKTRIKGWVF